MTATMKEDNVMNAAIVPCSGLEDKSNCDRILSMFEEVAVSRKVVKLGIEDLILSSSENRKILIYKAESVIFANDRSWEKVLFTDSLHARDFLKWQEGAATMMRDYESFGAHLPSSKLRNVLVWRAEVTVQEGTPVEELLKLLDQIKRSKDLVSVSIKAEGCTAVAQADDAVNLISWKKGARTVSRKTFVTVQFRWPTLEITKQHRGHKPTAFLTCCIFMIRATNRSIIQLEAQRKQYRDKRGELTRRQSAEPRLQSSGIRGLLAMEDHSDDTDDNEELQQRRTDLKATKSCPSPRLIAAGARRANWKGNASTDSYNSSPDSIQNRPTTKRSPSWLELDDNDDDRPKREQQRRRRKSVLRVKRAASCRSLGGLLMDAAHHASSSKFHRRRNSLRELPRRPASTLSLQEMVWAYASD